MAGLDHYRKKRDFQRTPEPPGGEAVAAGDDSLFVVHKHAARRLHYDLRLEYQGVLESWAVPKGPGLEPGEKRLAVKVEDHPLDYGDFEGVIPAGEYGAGTVMLWDRGRCRVKRRRPDRLDFVLEGHKLRGAWSLVRMGGRAGEEGNNWLLIRRSEQPPASSAVDEVSPAARMDLSVTSGRTMAQIAAEPGRSWTVGDREGLHELPDLQSIEGARRAPLPREPRPQLATLDAEAPEGEDWIHEIKFDGYRLLALCKRGRVRLISRNGHDWSDRFPQIAAQLGQLAVDDALLDGEVVALRADGSSSFGDLQLALTAQRTEHLVYQLFDLLHLNGFDLSRCALAERKRLLGRLLEPAGMVGGARLRYTDHVDGQGRDFFELASRLGLEGIVSKRLDAPYSAGRNKHWLKVKTSRHQELLVGGYTDPGGSRIGFGALLLGAWRGERLVYTGKVGTGFNNRQLEQLHARLRSLEVARSPFDEPPSERGVHWLRPETVVEVAFSEWTSDGALRHPVFRGLREDRDPAEIVLPREAPAGDEGGGRTVQRKAADAKRLRSGNAGGASGSGSSGSSSAGDRVAGVRLSNPDRVLYPQQGVTKLALAGFYAHIADWILPQLVNRPLSLLRCPQGRVEKCFFQKHPGEALAESIPRIVITEKDSRSHYLYVRELPDLIALVQAGTLELHVWGSRVDDLERPDMLVFDLDPGRGVSWAEVRRTAQALRERLADCELESFVRTTGGKGLHLVVPLVPKAGWDEVKRFCQGIAIAHAGDDPRRLTSNMSKAKREGRIFIDYLRNGRGATAIASYSTRAREGAPVAVPLRWDELSAATTSDRFNVGNLRRRLAALHSDPWEGFDETRRPLTQRVLDRVEAVVGRKRR